MKMKCYVLKIFIIFYKSLIGTNGTNFAYLVVIVEN